MRKREIPGPVRAVTLSFTLLLSCSLPLSATPILGSAVGFAVLGASAVTNTGPTTINGDLGVYPGSSITGTAGITFIGASTIHNTPLGLDPLSQQALTDQINAYNVLGSLPFTADLTGHDLGTSGTSPFGTLTSGVYRFATTAQLNGTLTLDAQNDPNAVFIFQIGTALTTASASSINVINGTPGMSLFWLMGVTGGAGTGSATLGTSTLFAGNILALDSITLTTGAEILCGRALAQNGAVTMDTNTISDNCDSFNNSTLRSDFGSLGFSGASDAVPEPATLALFAGALLLLTGRKYISARRP
ncbi:MAG: ice-binding family protein [Candidatus Solibacter sp.]